MALAAVCAAWLSAGLTPFKDAWVGARAPSDFATDFVAASHIGADPHSGKYVHPDIATGNAEAMRLGAPPYADVGVPFGAHPPPAVVLVAALVPLGFPIAAAAWLILSLGALAVVAWAVAGEVAFAPDAEDHRFRRALVLFALLSVWPPVLHNIEKGQWSLLLAGLLSGSWWAFTRGRDRWAGALIALAAAFKLIPLLALMAFMAVPRPRGLKVFLSAAATLVGVIVLSTLVMGPGAWLDFFRSAPINTRGWQTGPANTLSLWGALARFLVGGPFARPITSAPPAAWVAEIVWAIAAIALIGTAIRLSRRAHNRRIPAADVAGDQDQSDTPAWTFVAWCALVVTLNPLSWSHGAVLLVLPIALLATRICARTGGTRPSGSRLVLTATVVILTIPRTTLASWAGPAPFSPFAGLILGFPMAAGLTIFALALAAGARGRGPRSRAAASGPS